MSLLKTIKAQLGLSGTPANNFVLDASADNGTMKMARGNAGATTQDIMTVNAAGKVEFPLGLRKPMASATQSSNQSLSSTPSKLLFQTEQFDTHNFLASSRFQPNVAGIYRVSGAIQVSGNTASLALMAYLNGALNSYIASISVTSGILTSPVAGGSLLISLNGTTDYVELFGISGATLNTAANVATCYFQAEYEGSL